MKLMAVTSFDTFYLYRFRYLIGYTLLGVVFVVLLVFISLYIPGGISASEKQSAIQTAAINWHNLPENVVNLPYSLLQKLSFRVFGISDLSIKLPSLLLSIVAGGGLVLLLRRWFKPGVALLGAGIAVTTGQFLFVAQSGTPSILYVLWPVWLLVLGTSVSRLVTGRLLWKTLFLVAAALSLYTPLSLYVFIGLGFALIFHPHLRFVFRHLSKLQLIVAALIGLAIVAPLAIAVVKVPHTAFALLGIPTVWPNVLASAGTLFHEYFDFIQGQAGVIFTPVFGLGSVLLIAFGLWQLLRSREATQSYMLLVWIVCLIPIQLLNPNLTVITFVPAVLLLTGGLQWLIYYWYRLFPLNPYARIAGLIPLILLVGALVFSGLDRYAYGYYFSSTARAQFSDDLQLLPRSTAVLVVSPSELPFYQAVAKYDHGRLYVTTSPPGASLYTATRAAQQSQPNYFIADIITNSLSSQSDRFYVYQRND